MTIVTNHFFILVCLIYIYEVEKEGCRSLGFCEGKKGGIDIIQNEEIVKIMMVGIDHIFNSWRKF